ncbi:MAG: hypothetical protein BRC54_12925 [Cyanobacteria bacterium SW_7_48_12]|nr:MAG: hypothetical protein BRC54_12925 [Cyanobacteria bacterium SW_7_48_12]
MLGKLHQLCRSFKSTKKLLELLIEYQFFTLPDLTTYEAFSNLVTAMTAAWVSIPLACRLL